MKVSVIIPVFNSVEYIEKCLMSVFKQTFKDFEIIIIDDDSTDSSIEVINKLIQNCNQPVYIYRNNQNHGVSYSRNIGIQKARGEYLFFIDSDDSIASDCLEKLVAQTKSYAPDLVAADYELTSGLPTTKIKREGVLKRRELIQQSYFKYEWNEMVWNKLIRRDFILEHQLFFDETLRWHHDTLWSFIITFYLQTIVLLQDVTYYYHIHENSIVTGTSLKNGTNENLDVCEKMYQHVIESGCLTKNVNNYMIDFFVNIIIESILKKEYSLSFQYNCYCKVHSLQQHLSLRSYIKSDFSKGMKLFSLHQLLPKFMGFFYVYSFCAITK